MTKYTRAETYYSIRKEQQINKLTTLVLECLKKTHFICIHNSFIEKIKYRNNSHLQ